MKFYNIMICRNYPGSLEVSAPLDLPVPKERELIIFNVNKRKTGYDHNFSS